MLEFTIDPLPRHFERHVAETAVRIAVFEQKLRFPVFAFRKTAIHAKKHRGEIFRVIAARAREYGNDSIAFVVTIRPRKILFQRLIFSEEFLRAFLVCPEIGRAHLCLYLYNALFYVFLFHHEDSSTRPL